MSYMEQQAQSQIEGGISLMEEMDLQIAQLKVCNERLREALHNSLQCWSYDGVTDEHGSVFEESNNRCEETPAQSLAEVEACAIYHALRMVYHEEDDHRGYYSYEGLKLHADHIRLQAKENKL